MGEKVLAQIILYRDYPIWMTHQGTEFRVMSFRSETYNVSSVTVCVCVCVDVCLRICLYLYVCVRVRVTWVLNEPFTSQSLSPLTG